MVSQFQSIAALLLSTAFFLMAGGLVGTLTPLRASLEGFSNIAIGAMGAWYFTGFVAGCFAGPHLLARVGHIRAFAVAAAAVSAFVTLQPIFISPLVWFVIRGATGFGIAILFMTVESWLNDRADNHSRGRILSLYMMVNWLGLLTGQWLLLLAEPQSFRLFSAVSVLYCLCVVPMGLTRLPAPQLRPAPQINIDRIFHLAPVGAAGCLTVGLANGAFWTLAPLYTQSLGFSERGLALFMSVFIAGGAVVQWPLGRLSDRMDRRWIIAGACSAASACGIAIGFFGWLIAGFPALFFALVFALGASMLPLYSLSIAHANDRLPRSEFVEISAGLLMLSAGASIPAPLLASFVISAAGASSLFLYTAIAHAGLAFFAFTRMKLREPPFAETRELFAASPQGSPAALPLDPRGQERPSP
jgi:MFS family permease